MEVSQEKISDDHYYNVVVNGETIRTAINTAAKTHINATIFTSAPWYEALEGNIQKLTFYYKRKINYILPQSSGEFDPEGDPEP